MATELGHVLAAARRHTPVPAKRTGTVRASLGSSRYSVQMDGDPATVLVPVTNVSGLTISINSRYVVEFQPTGAGLLVGRVP